MLGVQAPFSSEPSVLVGNPEVRRPLERSRHRQMDNIKMDLGEI
jgi:hypothetical protein